MKRCQRKQGLGWRQREQAYKFTAHSGCGVENRLGDRSRGGTERKVIWKAVVIIQARDDETTSEIIAYLQERLGDLRKKTSLKPLIQLFARY